MTAELRVDGPGGYAVRFTPLPADTAVDYWRVAIDDTYLALTVTEYTWGKRLWSFLVQWDGSTRASSFVLENVATPDRAREITRHLVRQLINRVLPPTPDGADAYAAWLTALRVNQLFAERFPGVESLIQLPGRQLN